MKFRALLCVALAALAASFYVPAFAGSYSSYPAATSLQDSDLNLQNRAGAPSGGMVKVTNTLLRDYIDGKNNTFVTTHNTCDVDVTSDLETFMAAHGGYVNARPGDCWLVGDVGNTLTVSAPHITMNCPVAGTCTLKHNNDKSVVLDNVPDNLALDSKTLVTAIANPNNTTISGTDAINIDDRLTRLTVASVSGYHIGDYVLISDSVVLPSRIGGTKTITNVTWDGANSKCVVTTSAAHGYLNTSRVYIKGVTATVGGTKIDTLDGADGLGRTYNITLGDGTGANTTTKFTLQNLDNSTDTNTGTDVNCDTGTYASGGTGSTSNGWAGEANRVAGIDTLNKYIYLSHALQYKNLYVQSPVLYRYTRNNTFSINGFHIEANGDTSDLSIGISDPAIDVGGVPNATYSNLSFKNTWDAAILSRGTPAAIATNIFGELMPNRATNDPTGTPKTITDVSRASQAVFTSTAHGFTNGKSVYLSGMPSAFSAFNNINCRASDVAANTFKCKDTYGNYLDSSAFASAFSGSATAGELADVTGLGYLYSVYGAGFGTVIDGITSWEGRHTVTSDAVGATWSTTLGSSFRISRFGMPTYVTVSNGVCHDSYGVCWDTHEEVSDINFHNVSCYYSKRGTQYGSYEGTCAQIRGKNVTIDGMNQVGGKMGIRVQATDQDSVSNDYFKHITMRDLMDTGTNMGSTCSTGSTNAAVGIRVCSQVGNTNVRNIWIDDFETHNVAYPIVGWEKTKIYANDVRAYDVTAIADMFAGSSIRLMNSVYDETTYTHSPTTTFPIRLRSDGTNGGATAEVHGLFVVKNAANLPKHVFDENDTTASKKYWLDGYKEDNNGFTATTEVEAGETTLDELTDIGVGTIGH